MKTFLNFLDYFRIFGVSLGFYFSYQIGFENGYDPIAQLHFMVPVVVVIIAGISGLEGLLFGKVSAKNKGFETGSNYQKQSAIALLSYAFGALLVYFLHYGIKAELTILFTFLFFFVFSGINHAREAIIKKNYQWQNINRPFISLLMIAGFAYPVYMALKQL